MTDQSPSVAAKLSPWYPEAQEYLERFSQGVAIGQSFFLYPVEQVRISANGQTLYIGRRGHEGIEFALRRGTPGVWAWYPIDNDWREMTDTVADLVAQGATGSLKV